MEINILSAPTAASKSGNLFLRIALLLCYDPPSTLLCEGMMLQLQDFLNFDRYLTPSIIRIFYGLQNALIALAGVSRLVAALCLMFHSLIAGLVRIFIALIRILLG